MKQKLLLSTILSSLVFTSFNANAVVNLEYTIDGKFVVGGQQFNSFSAAAPLVDAYDRAGETIAIPKDSQKRYLTALLNSPTLRQDFVNTQNQYNDEYTINYGEFTAQLQKVQNIANTLGFTIDDIIENFDLSDILESDVEEIEDTIEYYENLAQSHQANIKLQQELAEVSKTNQQLQELYTKYLSATQNKNLDAATQQEAAKELFSRSELNEIKKNEESQDKLKSDLNIILNGLTSENDKLAEKAVKKLEELKNTIIIYITVNPTSATDLTPVQAPEGKTTYGVFNAVNPVTSDIGARLNNFVGVSAGSIMQRVGAWAKGIYSAGEQKTKGLSDGFKYNLAGGSIGVDVGEQNVVGVAYSFLSNKIESKLKNATKDEIPLHILSLYGMFSPNNELFISGQFQYGFGKVKKTKNTGDSQGSVAKAEPKTDLIRFSGQISYAFAIPNTDGSAIPTIGINHSTVNMDGYTEKGPGVNRTIEKMSFNRTAGTFGVSYKYTIKNNETIIEPEIHANGDYAFNIKNDDTKITLIKGLDPIVVPSEKTQKFLYSVGASVKLSPSRMVEINGGYDFTGGKDFTAHTGTVTVRVNF